MTKKEIKYLINIALVFVAVVIYFGARFIPRNATTGQEEKTVAYVARAVDGDTLKLSTGESVRLIGIDTPESRHNSKLERDVARKKKDVRAILKMGKEAANFTKQLTEDKQVRLEFDVQKRDKYGRLLAYVYLEDGTFVNAKIIEAGYAQVMTIQPNVKYADLFVKLQQEARKNARGLWRENSGKELF